jgi:hypothetical protein
MPPRGHAHREVLARIDSELAAAKHRLIDLGQQLGDAVLERDRSIADLAAARAAYRATTDGLSRSMRELEVAIMNGAPAAHVRSLQRQHVRAEFDAAAEYAERAQRWGHKLGDGPLRACTIGTNQQFASWAVHLGLYGNYRRTADDPAADVGVRLFRSHHAGSPQMKRTKLNVPVTLIDADIPLDQVLSHARSQPREDRKLRGWLGDHYAAVCASLT